MHVHRLDTYWIPKLACNDKPIERWPLGRHRKRWDEVHIGWSALDLILAKEEEQVEEETKPYAWYQMNLMTDKQKILASRQERTLLQ